MPEGIRTRIGKKGVGYQAWVYLPGGQRRSKTHPTLRDAKRWRSAQLADSSAGRKNPAARISIRSAGSDLIAAMESGAARTRSGDPYKPSVARGYEDDLRLHIYPRIGGALIGAVDRTDVQAIIEEMAAGGASASKIRNALMPLRVIYRNAIRARLVDESPCDHLALPSVRRDEPVRIAEPDEAARLLAVIPDADKAIWATAFYAGLRRGELRGLQVADVDLARSFIHVRRGWDDEEGGIRTKSRAGRRDVPIIALLRPTLEAAISGEAQTAHVFASKRGGPFNSGRVRLRAIDAWSKCVPPLAPIGLHDARHTFASTAIAAGCNLKELSTYMGHSSIVVTIDLYGHLLEGGDVEFRKRMDAFTLPKPTPKRRDRA